jgi:glycosyltransferase involved in cell wall biosynthesis
MFLGSLFIAFYSLRGCPKFGENYNPLYDNILSIDNPALPKELDFVKLKGKRVLVCLGMIKPYKGVPDLLAAFNNYTRISPNHSLCLIIGGKVYDPDVNATLDRLDAFTRDKLLLIDRRLSEAEMSALLRLANVSVTPYKKILISGSFYLSTTFGKPTIAPPLGMFQELINDGVTGILSDGTVAGLTDSLRRVNEMSSDHLAKIGDANFAANRHLTIRAVSERYFKTLGGCW